MKILIISDFHLGFGLGTERENDAFIALGEAISRSKDYDLILIAGDVFNTRTPTTEIFTRAMELFLETKLLKNRVRVIKGIDKDIEKIPKTVFFGIPIVSIHGNHERRIKGFLNPVEALERAGFLVYLHCNGIAFQKGDEKVCIQGMSGVPDQYADEVLKQWNSKPLDSFLNIFMFHQNISPVLDVPETLNLNQLPDGFDLYICGHFHEPKKITQDRKTLIIPGSLIASPIIPETKPKGFWIFDTKTKTTEFKEFENQRKVYYKEFSARNKEPIETYIKDILEAPHKMKPLIRIRLKGKGLELEKEIKNRFPNALISFTRELEAEELTIRTIEEQKLSVQELSKKLLRQNLQEFKLDPKIWENVFELFLEKKSEDVAGLLSKELRAKK